MTNKAFSKRMLDSKKHTGGGTQSYKWKYHPTPWKVFVDAVTKPQETILPRFGSKRFVLAIVALAVIIGGVALAQGPLFHSIIRNPNYSDSDPFTLLWNDANTAHNQGGFSCFSPLNGIVLNNCRSAGFAGLDTLKLQPNSTHTSVALSTSTMDLSTVSGKILLMQFSWLVTAPFNTNIPWGFFLTTNATLPTQSGYDPLNDKNIVLLGQSKELSASNFDQDILMLRTLGQGHTMNSEDTGQCPSSGEAYLCKAFTTSNAGSAPQDWMYFLNFTGGGSHTVGCTANTPTLNNIAGPGCSFFVHADNGAAGVDDAASSQSLPWFNFQAQQYYLGFYAKNGFGTGYVQFFFDQSLLALGTGNLAGLNKEGVMAFYTFTPATGSTTVPYVDTGGFFGPIIRALISIGVFIAQNIINFLAFLAGVLFPVLATVFGVLANALVGALNAIGNFFGLGNIGTTIQSFFSAIGSFLVNGVSAVIGQIGNAVSFFVNGTTAFVNIAGTYWAKITSFFTALGNLLSIIGTVFNDLLALGTFSGNLALFMDWTWGMYKTYDEGTEGFQRWLDFNENVFLRVGKVAYFLSDHLFTIILRVKQLIVQWV